MSVVLMTVVFTASIVGFRSRANISDSLSKAISRYAAEACVEVALLKLAENPLYDGNESVNLEGAECDIGAVETIVGPPLQKVVHTNSSIVGTETLLKVMVGAIDLSVDSWEEE